MTENGCYIEGILGFYKVTSFRHYVTNFNHLYYLYLNNKDGYQRQSQLRNIALSIT